LIKKIKLPEIIEAISLMNNNKNVYYCQDLLPPFMILEKQSDKYTQASHG
jgi:hypothetical protein